MTSELSFQNTERPRGGRRIGAANVPQFPMAVNDGMADQKTSSLLGLHRIKSYFAHVDPAKACEAPCFAIPGHSPHSNLQIDVHEISNVSLPSCHCVRKDEPLARNRKFYAPDELKVRAREKCSAGVESH